MGIVSDDFKFIAKTKKIRYWETNKCPKCKEGAGFMFMRGQVYRDDSCDCSSRDLSRQSNWGEVAEYYNNTACEGSLKKYQLFWMLD
nr:hypothetical protein BCU57_20200 [Shewanella sp. 10N.286.48.B5]